MRNWNARSMLHLNIWDLYRLVDMEDPTTTDRAKSVKRVRHHVVGGGEEKGIFYDLKAMRYTCFF